MSIMGNHGKSRWTRRRKPGFSSVARLLPVTVFTLVCMFMPSYVFAENVEILRDTYGIPHVFADSPKGAYYGAGWSLAEDEGFKFICSLLAARGQSAEFLHTNPKDLDMSMINRDIEARAFQYYELASDWEPMPSDVKMIISEIDLGNTMGLQQRAL